jgi:hypothetical protein
MFLRKLSGSRIHNSQRLRNHTSILSSQRRLHNPATMQNDLEIAGEREASMARWEHVYAVDALSK